MAMIGTSAAPTTEKQPLIPQAQMNMPSFPSRASHVMPDRHGEAHQERRRRDQGEGNHQTPAIGKRADPVEDRIEEVP